MNNPEMEAICARLRQRYEEAMNEAANLPCRGLDDETGSTRCHEVGVFKDCRYREEADFCPRRRLFDSEGYFEHNLMRAGVPPLERGWLMDARRDRSRLKKTIALRAVSAIVERKPLDYRGSDGEVVVRGSESLVVLAGPTGVGKTIAACYALGKLGGKYTRGYALGAERLTKEDRKDLGSTPCVVVDQLGRTQDRDSYQAQTVEEVVDLRTASRLLTIFVGNFVRADFESAFGDVVVSRLSGSGVWVEAKGEDMRRGDGHGTR